MRAARAFKPAMAASASTTATATCQAWASPLAMRAGINTGENGGIIDRATAMRLWIGNHPEEREVCADDEHRDRRSHRTNVVLPGYERAPSGVDQGIDDESKHEPEQSTSDGRESDDRHADRLRGRRGDEGDSSEDRELRQSDQPDADHFAEQELAR